MREQSGGEKKRNNMKKKERREARRNKHLKNVGFVCWPLLFSTFLVLTSVSVVLSLVSSPVVILYAHTVFQLKAMPPTRDLATSFAETNAT